jgi:hypothetical protein
MPEFFHTRDELKSSFGTRRMKPYIPEWPLLLEHLRICWEQGEATILHTPFVEWFEKPKRILE